MSLMEDYKEVLSLTCRNLSDASDISPKADILGGNFPAFVKEAKTAISGCSGVITSSGFAAETILILLAFS